MISKNHHKPVLNRRDNLRHVTVCTLFDAWDFKHDYPKSFRETDTFEAAHRLKLACSCGEYDQTRMLKALGPNAPDELTDAVLAGSPLSEAKPHTTSPGNFRAFQHRTKDNLDAIRSPRSNGKGTQAFQDAVSARIICPHCGNDQPQNYV